MKLLITVDREIVFRNINHRRKMVISKRNIKKKLDLKIKSKSNLNKSPSVYYCSRTEDSNVI